MKKSIYLSFLASLSVATASAVTTVYSHWDNFSNLNSQSGTQTNVIALKGGLTETNGVLHFDDTSGKFASIDAFTSGTQMGWLASQTSCLQLTISNLELGSELKQLFLYQGATSSGVAADNNGLITDGNNMKSWGSAFSSAGIADTFTLTIAQNNSGTFYYLNGLQVHSESGWKASNRTWTGLQFGNSYSSTSGGTIGGAIFDLHNMELFSVDSTEGNSIALAVQERFKALPSASIPEPTSFSLGILGLVSLLMSRRRLAH